MNQPSSLIRIAKRTIRVVAWCALLVILLPMAFFVLALVRHELGFGKNLSIHQSQQAISGLTRGCSRGGAAPRGISRSFWLDYESWFEFDLTEDELNCVREKVKVVNCACSEGGRHERPEWFRPEGATFTIIDKDYDLHPCIWHRPGGKYWSAGSDGVHCYTAQSLENLGLSRLEWLTINVEIPERVSRGQKIPVTFSYRNGGIVNVSIDLPSGEGCLARNWKSKDCPFEFLDSECRGYSPLKTIIGPSKSFEYSIEAVVKPDAPAGDHSCRMSAFIHESAPLKRSDLKVASKISTRVIEDGS